MRGTLSGEALGQVKGGTSRSWRRCDVGTFLTRTVEGSCSPGPRKVSACGLSVRKWDFLFYVVRPSRHELREGVGVLAVFSFLIVPIVCSTLLGRRGQGRLYWAWAIGIVVSILGAVFSYLKDWPMGATIVCLFGVTVAIISLSVRMKYVDAVANGEHHSTGELRDAEEVPIRAAGR